VFRTVIVVSGEKISVKNNWLIIENGNDDTMIPIEDIYSIVIDNIKSNITVPALTRLTEAGVHLLVCDEKHLPATVILPASNHYRPLNVLMKQIQMTDNFKKELWQRIIKQKILNQARVLKISGAPKEKYEKMLSYCEEVVPGDEYNREGIAAKWFFRALYGSEFIRFSNDVINDALNYGYTIIRSLVAKVLSAYGYNCVIGIHHINESNPFNLADDLMEPLRPLVDLWVEKNNEYLVDKLTKDNRQSLINLINHVVIINNNKMKLRNAVDRYINSLTTAINRMDSEALIIPQIFEYNEYFEEDGDD